MGYIITNERIYIRLNESGAPASVSKKDAQVFTKEKAENILKALPKVLKNFHLKVKYVEEEVEVIKPEKEKSEKDDKKYLKSESYAPCDEVMEWIRKAETINDFSKNIKARIQVLYKKLSNADKELSNTMHEIELSRWKNGCEGYKEYKIVKEILEKRRKIKDELSVLQSISNNTKCQIDIKNIRRTFNRLGTRKFEIRIIEDDLDDSKEVVG